MTAAHAVDYITAEELGASRVQIFYDKYYTWLLCALEREKAIYSVNIIEKIVQNIGLLIPCL